MAIAAEYAIPPPCSFSRVLVADDERHIVRLIQVNLERSGRKVVCAFSGEEALTLLDSEQPDLLILDASMSPMSGYDVMREVRADPLTAHIPVWILWARSPDPEKDHQWQPGADYYVQKPFNPYELVKMVMGR